MRCAILVPEWHVEDIFLSAFARSMGSYQEPSGPLYVAAALRDAGHEVFFMDGALHGNDEILRRTWAWKPDFVGLSVVAPLWPSARRLLRELRRYLPDALLALGGPWGATQAVQSLRECPSLDLVFTGEGEHAAVEALEVVERGGGLGALGRVAGVVHRDPATGEPVQGPPARPIEDLDALPFPARDLLGEDIKRCTLPPGGYRASPVAHLIGSRGCTNRCIYCFQMDRKAVIRFRSAENIVDEMEECVQRWGFRELRFLDDNFTADRERVFAVCDLIEQRGLRVPWYVSSRVDTVDPEMLRRMKEAGCWAMLFGAETGVEKNLRTLRKNVTLEQTRRAVRWAHEAGIETFLPFMFGIPGETFEEGLRTIDFALELDPYYANFNAIAAFPGTWLWRHGKELGELDEDPERMTFQAYGFVPHSMTREQIERLRQLAFRRFYSRPRFAWRWLKHLDNRAVAWAVMNGIPSFFALWTKRDAFHK